MNYYEVNEVVNLVNKVRDHEQSEIVDLVNKIHETLGCEFGITTKEKLQHILGAVINLIEREQ